MSQDEQIWLHHLDAIAAENITTKAYADREGLPVWRLYDQRKKLARTRKALGMEVEAGRARASERLPSRGFVSVQLPEQRGPAMDPAHPDPAPADAACRLQLHNGMHLEFPALPDVHWLRQLICAAPSATGAV